MIEYSKSEKLLEQVKLLHFHIGSQVPDIRAFKNAISEAPFYGAGEAGTTLEYLTCGGLGVDYDGSRPFVILQELLHSRTAMTL